jgi:hypothetical protein
MVADFFVSPDFLCTSIASPKQATHLHNKAGSEFLLAKAKQAAPKLLMVQAHSRGPDFHRCTPRDALKFLIALSKRVWAQACSPIANKTIP